MCVNVCTRNQETSIGLDTPVDDFYNTNIEVTVMFQPHRGNKLNRTFQPSPFSQFPAGIDEVVPTLMQWFASYCMKQTKRKKPVISRICGQLNGCVLYVLYVRLINFIITFSQSKTKLNNIIYQL